MLKEILENNKFTDHALQALEIAQAIAADMKSETVLSWHILAAITHLVPEVTTELLGKNIPDLIKVLKINWEPYFNQRIKVKFSDELSALLIDTTEEAPLTFIKSFFPDKVLSPVDLAFIVLKEPSDGVTAILAEYNITNDYNELSETLCNNYLSCCEKYSGVSPKERLKKCIEMGKRFSDYMTAHLIGQEKAVEAVTSSLVNFWYKGNQQKPLPILLLSQAGGGKSFFARTMQEAFVNLGLQKDSYSALDISCLTHNEATDCELLGSDKSYKCARPGLIYESSQKNRRGIMVFENIQFGCDSARRILSALTKNDAYDKFFQKNIRLPFNILVFTLSLTDNQHDLLMKNGTDSLDVQDLIKLLDDQNDKQIDLSLLAAMQDFIFLNELKKEDLENMIRKEFYALEESLQKEYQIALSAPGKNDFYALLMQTTPHQFSPKELSMVIKKEFNRINKAVVRFPGIEKIEVHCDPLPVYPHDITRRTVRGDYLTFTVEEEHRGDSCIISYKNLKYTTQSNIECGTYRIERPKNLSLSDIVGLDSQIAELQDALDYITGKYGDSTLPPPALGYILEGPPGTGKTATIAALASQADVPVFFANSAVFADAKKIDDLFSKAKKMAPAIVVMDELNSIGRADQSWRVDAINTLLSHMDGMEESAKLLVLGSTNYVNQIEIALRRPGRFTRIVHIGVPDNDARSLYVRKFEQKYAFALEEKDREEFVALTDGKTIAVIKSVLEHALRTSVRTEKKLDFALLKVSFEHIISHDSKNSANTIGFNGANAR